MGSAWAGARTRPWCSGFCGGGRGGQSVTGAAAVIKKVGGGGLRTSAPPPSGLARRGLGGSVLALGWAGSACGTAFWCVNFSRVGRCAAEAGSPRKIKWGVRVCGVFLPTAPSRAGPRGPSTSRCRSLFRTNYAVASYLAGWRLLAAITENRAQNQSQEGQKNATDARSTLCALCARRLIGAPHATAAV